MTEKELNVRDSNVKINYILEGQGDTTLLFLHGWCINSSYWLSQLNYFESKYQVCAMDLPGFGKSTAIRNEWTIDEYAQDVLALIDDLKLENIVLICHSMAGDIMVQCALTGNSKIIGLVGIDNFKIIDFEFTPEQIEQMSAFIPQLQSDFKNSVVAYANLMLFHPNTATEVKERIKRNLSSSDPTIGYNTMIHQMNFSQQIPQMLEALPYKLNLINCDGFPTYEPGLKIRCKNGYNLKQIIGAGHYPMIEKPEEVNKLLEEILSEGVN
ncbi:MAG: alpha/beta hydrolase [Bacteroidales bacterium]|nr:alpha/beta hydrolase [Bacteroidales bacterium]